MFGNVLTAPSVDYLCCGCCRRAYRACASERISHEIHDRLSERVAGGKKTKPVWDILIIVS